MSFKEKEFHKEENCLNCGYPLIGKYCGHCGQKAFLHKDSFWHMVMHFAGDYFHYDNKFWTTIKALFLKPGLITLEYIEGKRAKYLNPIQLYIFVSTLFFLLFFSSSNEDSSKKKDRHNLVSIDSIDHKPATDSSIQQVIHEIIDSSNQKTLESEDSSNGFTLTEPFVDDDTNSEIKHKKYESLADYDSIQQALPLIQQDGVIKKYINRRYYSIKDRYPDKHSFSEAFSDKIEHNVPKAFFLLLPVFAVFLKILFTRKKLYYVDHVIFSIHFHSFIFILFSIPEIIDKFLDNEFLYPFLQLVFFLGIGVYLYIAIKRVYPSATWKRLLKQCILTFAYFISFVITLILLLAFTVIFI